MKDSSSSVSLPPFCAPLSRWFVHLVFYNFLTQPTETAFSPFCSMEKKPTQKRYVFSKCSLSSSGFLSEDLAFCSPAGR